MLIDVAEPFRNLVLNACFYSIALLTVVAVVPWGYLGAVRLSGVLRWAAIPVLGLAIAYEWAMPARFDIRLDLLLLLPAIGVVLVSSVFRWVALRASRKRRQPTGAD